MDHSPQMHFYVVATAAQKLLRKRVQRTFRDRRINYFSHPDLLRRLVLTRNEMRASPQVPGVTGWTNALTHDIVALQELAEEAPPRSHEIKREHERLPMQQPSATPCFL